MKLKAIVSAALEVALFFKKIYQRNSKANYESNRLKDSNSAADEFERQFNPNGLRSSENLSGNKADHGEGSRL